MDDKESLRGSLTDKAPSENTSAEKPSAGENAASSESSGSGKFSSLKSEAGHAAVGLGGQAVGNAYNNMNSEIGSSLDQQGDPSQETSNSIQQPMDQAKSAAGNYAGSKIQGAINDRFNAPHSANPEAEAGASANGINMGKTPASNGEDLKSTVNMKRAGEGAKTTTDAIAGTGKSAADIAESNGVARHAQKIGKTIKESIKNSELAKDFAKAVIAILAFIIKFIIPILLVLLLAACAWWVISQNTSKKSVTDTTTYYSVSSKDKTVQQTWSGVFYKRYSTQSLYASVEEPEEASDAQYSGLSFETLTGRNKLKESDIYQEGTDEWTKIGVKDTNGKESQLALSIGTLSTLDKSLNGKYIAPEQFIKPVYSNCTADMAKFLADPNNDTDKDGKVTVKDCKLLDSNGELLLDSAQSAEYTAQDSATGLTSGETVMTKGTGMTDGRWDWGVGTVVHYKGYYQPSEIRNYKVKEIHFFCEPALFGKYDSGCTEATLGQVIDKEDPSTELVTALADSFYTGGEAGGKFYLPNSTIEYKDWNPTIREYVSKYGAQKVSTVYDGTKGEYLDASISPSDWVYEPSVSSGIPVTEVKYLIDYAMTFAGTVSNDIQQSWVKMADAEHTQYFVYRKALTPDELSNKVTYDSAVPVDADNQANAHKTVYYNGQMISTKNQYSYNEVFHWVDHKAAVHGTREVENTKWVSWEQDENGVWQPVTPHEVKYKTTETYVKEPEIFSHYEGEDGSYMGTQGVNMDKNSYSFGAYYEVTLDAYKKGDLVTEVAYYANSTPKTEEVVGIKYLQDYMSNYTAFLAYEENSANTNWNCYSMTDGGAAYNEAATGMDVDISNASSWSHSDTVSKTTAGIVKDDQSTDFCYADDSDNQLMTSFNTGNISNAQLYSLAAKMGFTSLSNGEAEEVEFEKNTLKDDIGSGSDTAYQDAISKYGEDYVKFGSMYGVDPTVLALITANDDVMSGNIMGADTGSYTAYNMGFRGETTEYQGGSVSGGSKSNAFNFADFAQSIVKWITGGWLNNKTSGGTSNVAALSGEETFNYTGSKTDALSEEQASIKAAAMKLQNLLSKYKGNWPMVLTAYRFNDDYVNAVLKVYEEQTGVDQETAIANTTDTAWLDYAKEVYDNPKKYAANIASDGGQDYTYADKVLSRLPKSALYYVQLDDYYNKTNERSADVNSDFTQHTPVVWYGSSLKDSNSDVEVSADTNATTTAIERAWKKLTADNTKSIEDSWKEISLNQKPYKYGLYKLGTVGADGVTDIAKNDPQTALYIHPELSQESIDIAIHQMFTFGTDANHNELNVESDEFWTSRFSSLFGAQKTDSSWDSTLNLDDIFGKKTTTGDNGEQKEESVTIKYFMRDDYTKLQKFGYYREDDGDVRKFHSSAIVQAKSGSIVGLYSIYDGTVTSLTNNDDGSKNVYIQLTTYNGNEIVVSYNGVTELESGITLGATVTADQKIGRTSSDGRIEVSMTVNGKYADFLSMVENAYSKYELESVGSHDVAPGDSSIFNWQSIGGNTGGSTGGGTGGSTGGGTVRGSYDGVLTPTSMQFTLSDIFGDMPATVTQKLHGETSVKYAYDISYSGSRGSHALYGEYPAIYAPADGFIVWADTDGVSWDVNHTGRLFFMMDGGDGYFYAFGFIHVMGTADSFPSGTSGFVSKGSIIGYMGNTGHVMGTNGIHSHTSVIRIKASSAEEAAKNFNRYPGENCTYGQASECWDDLTKVITDLNG